LDSQDFFKAATEGSDVKCIFSANYGEDLSISVYYVAKKDGSQKNFTATGVADR